jgi:hypothetical protein
MAAMVLSDRGMALLLLLLVFSSGLLAGVGISARQSAREVERLSTQAPSRPTLHERLDLIEHRLQSIEQRLAPSP